MIEAEPDFKVRIAQFLTRHDVSSILLTIAIIAMIIEIFMQGFGLPGIVSIIAFALYFGGGFLAGNTEWWAVLLFLIGLILLIIELFVPGFGVFGISGIISLVIAIILLHLRLFGYYNSGDSLAATAVWCLFCISCWRPRLFRKLFD